MGAIASEPSPIGTAILDKFERLQTLDRPASSGLVDRARLVLAERRGKRPHREIFGAQGHQYRRRSVGVAEIAALESRFDFTVPSELVGLWTVIGAGAGPYYGLFGPKEMAVELDDWADRGASVGRTLDLRADFPLAPLPQGEERVQVVEGPSPGAIPIAHHGCTYWSVLVVAGDQRGRVWDLANYEGAEFQWAVAMRPIGSIFPNEELPPFVEPPTLLEWYEGWLDASLASFPVRKSMPNLYMNWT